MKKDKVADKIKLHRDNKNYVNLIRKISKTDTVNSAGYILDYSADFVLIQEADNFRALGYNIFPIEQVEKVRFNKWDKYYDKVMRWEQEADNIGITYSIDLKTWKSIFISIQRRKMNVIVECEDPAVDSFSIGSIIHVNKNDIDIQNFNPAGLFDQEPTSITYCEITKVTFDDRYINVLSKYTRFKKE